MNNSTKWFVRALGLGMVLNCGFVVGTFVFPETLLRILGIGAPPLIWVRTAGMLLSMITLSYVPALRDPIHNRWTATYTIAPRLVSSAFFFTEVLAFGWDKGFLCIAVFDGTFGVLQAALASAMFRPATPAQIERHA